MVLCPTKGTSKLMETRNKLFSKRCLELEEKYRNYDDDDQDG